MHGDHAADHISRRRPRYEPCERSPYGEFPNRVLILGGGATGVETASELHQLVHEVLTPAYPNINPHRAWIILIDSNKEILDGREIKTENAIWTAGAHASGGTISTSPTTGARTSRWTPTCASMVTASSGASATARQTCRRAVARNVLAAMNGEELEYKPLGQLVEMGSEFAFNEVLGVKFSGRMAALFWRVTYQYKLESPQCRAHIAADWLLEFFIPRLVT